MSGQCDILQVEGINSKGFGILPKLVMQDARLSATAKAIYGYFCSYAGAGKQAFPRVTRIMNDLGLCRSAYYRHFNQLRNCGYITARQEHRNGKLSHNVYTLVQTVQSAEIQHTEIQDAVFQYTVLQNAEKQYTRKSNSLENQQSPKSNSISQSGQSSPSRLQTMAGHDGEYEYGEAEIAACYDIVRHNIRYNDFELTHPHDMAQVDEIVSIIVDALVSDSPYVRVDGEDKPRALVRHVFRELGYQNVELVLTQFKALTGLIQRKRQYLFTMLYNSRHEVEAHYTNSVNAHLNGGV